jgi:hypothetical protein
MTLGESVERGATPLAHAIQLVAHGALILLIDHSAVDRGLGRVG